MSLQRVKLFLMDVDGTLTDGRIIVNDQGVETKVFSVHDGLAIRYLQSAGIRAAWVSGRSSKLVEIRAKELGVEELMMGVEVKLQALEKIVERHELELHEVAYIGDDLSDLPVMRQVGYAFAPSDARDEVKEFAHCVTAAPGGGGAVSEAVEKLLKAQGKWDEILSRYL